MAVTKEGNITRVTASLDTVFSAGIVQDVRILLVAGSDAATAVLKLNDANGQQILKIAAPANDTVEVGCLRLTGKIHITLTGTSPEVYILEEIG